MIHENLPLSRGILKQQLPGAQTSPKNNTIEHGVWIYPLKFFRPFDKISFAAIRITTPGRISLQKVMVGSNHNGDGGDSIKRYARSDFTQYSADRLRKSIKEKYRQGKRRTAMKAISKHPFYQVAAVIVTALMTLTTTVPITFAASHREAPLIALDPAADNTDTYAFRSWQDPNKVVFIMNVIPGQDPADGPNYFNFDDEVLYAINIDNDQDGKADDIVYEFRFKTETRPIFNQLNFPLPYVGNPNIPVPELQGITRLDGPGSEGLTRRQTYTVTEVRGKKRTQVFKGQKLVAVPSNAGPATFKNYADLASQGMPRPSTST